MHYSICISAGSTNISSDVTDSNFSNLSRGDLAGVKNTNLAQLKTTSEPEWVT